MADRKYYVICAAGCRFESMTKEQILTAITQAVNDGTISDIDSGFVTTLKEQNRNAGLSFWVGTQAEYNAIPEKAENCFYITTDDTIEDDLFAAIEEITKSVAAMPNDIINAVYPIGSIYMSVNATNPSILFGGTWELWGAGKVPVGVDAADADFATAESTGGEKAHKMANYELAPHYHGMYHSHDCTEADIATTASAKQAINYAASTTSVVEVNTADHQHAILLNDAKTGTYEGNTSAFPSSAEQKAMSLMQPYITCYMFKRTA